MPFLLGWVWILSFLFFSFLFSTPHSPFSFQIIFPAGAYLLFYLIGFGVYFVTFLFPFFFLFFFSFFHGKKKERGKQLSLPHRINSTTQHQQKIKREREIEVKRFFLEGKGRKREERRAKERKERKEKRRKEKRKEEEKRRGKKKERNRWEKGSKSDTSKKNHKNRSLTSPIK